MTARQALVVALVALAAVAGGVGGTVGASAAADTAPTYVETDVTEDTTWTAAGGPYFVGDDVTVAAGATLTVEPGTRVNLAEEVTLTVEGSLLAAGNASAPVSFTTADPASGADTWRTIEYAGGSDSTLRLEHAVVEHGTTGVTATSAAGSVEVVDSTVREHVQAGLAVRARSGAPTLRVADARFADTGSAGVSVATAETDPYVDSLRNARITGTTFAGTGANGVRVRARQMTDVTVADVTVSGTSGTGVAFEMASTAARPQSTQGHSAEGVRVRGVTVRNAGGDGVAFRGGALDDVAVVDSEVHAAADAGLRVEAGTDADDVRFARNTVVDSAHGLQVSLRRTAGGIQHVSLAVEANDFSRNDGYGVDASAEYVFVDAFDVRNNTLAGNGDGGATVGTQQLDDTVFADNVVRANDGPGVDVSAVRVRGVTVSENRLVANADDGLSVRADDVLGGLDVGHNDVFDNDAFGVDVAGGEPGAASRVHNNTIAANGNGVRVAGPTETQLVDNAVVLNTAGRESFDGDRTGTATGVVVESSAVDLARNDVYGHIVGLRSATETTDGTVDAESNYWGAESGPYHETLNPGGAGDAVVTDRGKADPVPYASEPFGPAYERPTAALVANETTVEPGDDVAFSARRSSDDGPIATHYFTVDGERHATPSATYVTSFEETGAHEVSLVVEDGMGVRSLDDATVNVTVQAAQSTTTPPTTTTAAGATTPATATPTTPDEEDDSLLSSLGSIWGGLGGLFYALALVLGTYGTWLSVRGREPPVAGTTIHALAGVGVLVWAVAGVLTNGALLTVAGVGAVAWGGLTAVVLGVAAR